MVTKGYIETGRGELLISYVQSFATIGLFAKAHPEISVDEIKKIYNECKPVKESEPLKKETSPNNDLGLAKK